MAIKTLPTLTLDGFLTHPTQLMVKLYEYFLTSDYSQSVIFYTHIKSLNYLINQYSDDTRVLQKNIRESLLKLYNDYFSVQELNVNLIPSGGEDNEEIFALDVEIIVIDDLGETYTFKRSMSIERNSFLNNYDRFEYLLKGEV